VSSINIVDIGRMYINFKNPINGNFYHNFYHNNSQMEIFPLDIKEYVDKIASKS
jgi:hypothetical protein